MSENGIQKSAIVQRLQRLVVEHGSQRAAAKALGNEGFQSSISNAVNGIRMPSEELREALDAYDAQGILTFSIGLPIEKTTPKFCLFKATSDEGYIVSVYAPKAKVGSNPPEAIEAVVKLLLP